MELEQDKIACVLGPSGCGKTTMLKLIAGLDKVQSGEIYLNDNLVSSTTNTFKNRKKKNWFSFSRLCSFSSPNCKRKSKLCYSKS